MEKDTYLLHAMTDIKCILLYKCETAFLLFKDRLTPKRCTIICNAHNFVKSDSIWTKFGEYTPWMMLYRETKYFSDFQPNLYSWMGILLECIVQLHINI